MLSSPARYPPARTQAVRLNRASSDADFLAIGIDRLAASPDLGNLLRLLTVLDLQLEVARVAPPEVWLAAAVDPVARSACAGKGWSAGAAVAGCLGELVERRSLVAATDQIERHPVAGERLDIASTLGFSAAQRADRDRLNRLWQGYEVIPDAATLSSLDRWCRLEPLSKGRPVLAPAAICLALDGQQETFGGPRILCDSTGTAAGADIDAATRSALLEIVERDAAGIWWYGRCRRPAIRLDPGRSPTLTAALAARAPDRPLWFLDLTHDLGPAVVAAISCSPEHGLPAIGIAAAADATAAAEAAFLELAQGEMSLAICRLRWAARAEGSLSNEDRRLRHWLAAMTPARMAWMRPLGERPVGAIIARPVDAEALARRGLPCWRLDLTRADLAVPAVRVLAPGAATLRPRLGTTRLERVPVQLGWQPADYALPDLGELPPVGF